MRRKPIQQPPEEMNLAPFLNLVVVLIPLLLLSVVFEEIGVIPVDSPKLITGPIKEIIGEPPPLNLRVLISERGFMLDTQGRWTAPADPRCQEATVCVKDSTQTRQLLVNAKAELRHFDQTQDKTHLKASQNHLNDLRDQYDFDMLRDTLGSLKKTFPDHINVNIAADPHIPYDVVVATMDTTRGPASNRIFENVLLSVID